MRTGLDVSRDGGDTPGGPPSHTDRSVIRHDRDGGAPGRAVWVISRRSVSEVADAGHLLFPDDAFDVVVANHMLYHLPRPANLRGGVAAARRGLRRPAAGRNDQEVRVGHRAAAAPGELRRSEVARLPRCTAVHRPRPRDRLPHRLAARPDRLTQSSAPRCGMPCRRVRSGRRRAHDRPRLAWLFAAGREVSAEASRSATSATSRRWQPAFRGR